MFHCGAGRIDSPDVKSGEGTEDGKMSEGRREETFYAAQSWKDPPTQMKENSSADGQVHQGEVRWWGELGGCKKAHPATGSVPELLQGGSPRKVAAMV